MGSGSAMLHRLGGRECGRAGAHVLTPLNFTARMQLTDRRSNAAKARMRLLVQQAQEVNTGRSNARKAKKAKLAEDRFGENEEDWSVYREIVRLLARAGGWSRWHLALLVVGLTVVTFVPLCRSLPSVRPRLLCAQGRDDSTGTEEEDSRLARMAEIDAILEQHMPSVPEEVRLAVNNHLFLV